MVFSVFPLTNENITLSPILSSLSASPSFFDFVEFEGFSVWRKSGCDSFIPDYCEQGVAHRGYQKISGNFKAYTYLDNTARTGQKYSYRIIAHFAKRSLGGGQIIEESLSPPSNEFCIELKLDLPVLVNVDVIKFMLTRST